MKKGVCCHCLGIDYLTTHHVFPKRFFGYKNNFSKLMICRKCHDEIEEILPRYTQLKQSEYLSIHRKWLRGQMPMVVIDRGRLKRV